jgi:hypothetical protein
VHHDWVVVRPAGLGNDNLLLVVPLGFGLAEWPFGALWQWLEALSTS